MSGIPAPAANLLLTTVAAPAGVHVVAYGPITHLCPHVEEVDEGFVRFEWTTAGQTVELHSLRTFVDAFDEAAIAHEDLVELFRRYLSDLPGIREVVVSAEFDTADFEVTAVAR